MKYAYPLVGTAVLAAAIVFSTTSVPCLSRVQSYGCPVMLS